jgi:hypothetical protein
MLLIWLFLAGGLLASFYVRDRGRRVVGEPLHEVGTSLRARIGWTLVLAVLGVVVSSGYPAEPAPGLPSVSDLWVTLVLTGLLVWKLPHATEAVCGRHGVRFGWSVSAYEDVEAWRLTGDHLRCLLKGRWLAMAVPPARHGELRGHLQREAKRAQSEFS